MRLGSSLFRHCFRREVPAWALGAALAGFILVEWGVLGTSDEDVFTDFQVERLIAAAVLADAAGEDRPEWERGIAEISSAELRDWTREQCESAEHQGFFPREVYPSWALAALWFGDREYAEQVTPKILRSDPIGRLVIAAIRERTPDNEDLEVVHKRFAENSASWREAYLLVLLTPDNDHLRDWMREVGHRSYQRSVIQASVSWLAYGIGLLAAGWLLIRRKHVWISARRPDRLPSTWRLQTFLTVLFGGLAMSAMIPVIAGFLPIEHPDSWAMATFFIYLGFLGVPAFLLSAFLTPSFRATGRLFGLIDPADSKRSIVLAGLALFFALVLLSRGLEWLWTELRIDDLRDWLRFEILDSHLGFAVSLAAAGILAPLFEELIFRGFLFRALRNHLSPLISATLSSALFATYHWYSLSGWITVFLMGLMFCGMAYWSRSLWPGIIAHSLFNLLMTWAVWANFSFV